MSKLSGIDIIGIDSGNLSNISPQENIILRIDKKNPIADYFPYLIVADNIRSLDSKTDLFLIDPFQGKDALKRKAKRGLGIEISINPVKKLDTHLVAQWLKELKSIYVLCQSNDCQFILSSGATSINEMISARSFESILTVVGINPRRYWMKISEWLYAKTKARWQYVKS
ncbi:MAG TPA: hypothetical protein VD694_01245 [Nitrososphaeraceae archaeon]|nr:hypothetical protein [Nitrososphaeraceae archaeon]